MYSSYSLGIDYMPLLLYSSMPVGFVEDYYTENEFVHFRLQWSPDKALVLDSELLSRQVMEEIHSSKETQCNIVNIVKYDNWTFE